MIQLITPDRYGEFADELAAMHRLRYRVFKERLGWDVEAAGDMEIDDFDALHPIYLLQRDAGGTVQGCVRLLPSTGPTMLRDTFPVLLGGQPAPATPTVWESSRFALDLPPTAPKAASGLAKATHELFAGMIEFGLSRQLADIVTVTDVSMERLLRRAAWPLRRLGKPCRLGATRAVAGCLEISAERLAHVRRAGGLCGPVLWAPVMLAAA
jgi:acyl homoserine lactone synthase